MVNPAQRSGDGFQGMNDMSIREGAKLVRIGLRDKRDGVKARVARRFLEHINSPCWLALNTSSIRRGTAGVISAVPRPALVFKASNLPASTPLAASSPRGVIARDNLHSLGGFLFRAHPFRAPAPTRRECRSDRVIKTFHYDPQKRVERDCRPALRSLTKRATSFVFNIGANDGFFFEQTIPIPEQWSR